MNGKYHVTYDAKMHPEGVAKEDIPAGHGACDELLIVSVIHDASGASSTLFSGHNGIKSAPADDAAWFHAWTLMAKNLSESKTLPAAARTLCGIVFENIKHAVVAAKKKEQSDG